MTPPVTIALAGDVMLGRGVQRAIDERGLAYPWGDLLPELAAADGFFINLECALTDHRRRWRDRDGALKAFYFRAHPRVVATLQLAGVDLAVLANNHAADYGMTGLLDTVRHLDEAGIAHAGAGADLTAARTPGFVSAGQARLAVVACADYPVAWAAKPTAPGINYTPVTLADDDFTAIAQALAEVRRQADLVVFSIHWGPNMRARPTPQFREFAQGVVEAGADLFWGHSAHVVQGVELWQGKPILFDTGDFVDDYAVDSALRNDLSALFLLRLGAAVERIEVVPVAIGRCQVNRARGAERAWFAERFMTLCAELGTEVLAADEMLTIPFGTLPGQEAAAHREANSGRRSWWI